MHQVITEGPILAYRTAILYLLALAVFRLMGKRSMGKMAPFDVAVIIIIGESVAIAMEDVKTSLLYAAIPIVVLGTLQFLLTLINLHSTKVEEITQGVPRILVHNGQVDAANQLRERITQADLMMGLREQGVDKLSDVAEANLEPTGKVSVILAPGATALRTSDFERKIPAGLNEILEDHRRRTVEEVLAALRERESVVASVPESDSRQEMGAPTRNIPSAN